MEELARLAESADYTVVGKIEQIREGDARYQIGVGKVQELSQLVKETNAEKVIFDNHLKTVQAYNLAKATAVENIDRLQLILEIFTKRATTTEAQLQIRLARLKRDLAQAKEKVRLAKKGEQPGFMGLGAYEVDVYQESVKKEVHAIQRKLKRIRGKRVLHRKRRAELGFPTISLSGYTNAGKSSLFNALTEEKVPVERTLFTTLSTTMRLIEVSRKKFLLIDTVGFIDRLPLTLIEAFHSTLEETIYSDLILLVVDMNDPVETIRKKLAVCSETIERIGAAGIPLITVLNKIDLITPTAVNQKLNELKTIAKNPVTVSALNGTNLDKLESQILIELSDFVKASFTVPMTAQAMPFISWVFKNADVQTINYSGNAAHVVFESNPELAEKVRDRVERLDGKFEKK